MEGRLDLIGPDAASGWAFAGAEPVRVELRHAGTVLAADEATIFRDDGDRNQSVAALVHPRPIRRLFELRYGWKDRAPLSR